MVDFKFEIGRRPTVQQHFLINVHTVDKHLSTRFYVFIVES